MFRDTAIDHVDHLLATCCTLGALCEVTASHQPLCRMCSRLQSSQRCAPAWSGTCSAANLVRLDSFLNRCKTLGFVDKDLSPITELFIDADDAFFEQIMTMRICYNRSYPRNLICHMISENVLTIDR